MAGADVLNIGDADFEREVLKSEHPVLVDFWATWCAPCRAIAPAVEELATQYKGKVKVAKVNIDDNQDTPQQYGIRSIPTLLVFKGGKVVEQIVGAVPKARLEAAIQKVVTTGGSSAPRGALHRASARSCGMSGFSPAAPGCG